MDAREYIMAHRPKLIGFLGIKQSGKSEAAKYIQREYGYARTRVAQPLKDMLRAFGLSEAEIDGDLKELPSEKLGGKSPRWAMQSLGTEWGRSLIDGDVWLNAWISRVKSEQFCCVDDLRFPNEVQAFKDMGGILIRVDRFQATSDNHASEHAVSHVTPDIVIQNTGTLQELYKQMDDVVCIPQRRPSRTNRT